MYRALRPLMAVLALLVAAPLVAQTATRRPLQPSDVYRVRDVRDPQRSPDGRWVAYTVTVADSAKDRNDTDVWMVSWDGRDDIRLTSSPESESRPRWSPDGRYLSFVSSRQGARAQAPGATSTSRDPGWCRRGSGGCPSTSRRPTRSSSQCSSSR